MDLQKGINKGLTRSNLKSEIFKNLTRCRLKYRSISIRFLLYIYIKQNLFLKHKKIRHLYNDTTTNPMGLTVGFRVLSIIFYFVVTTIEYRPKDTRDSGFKFRETRNYLWDIRDSSQVEIWNLLFPQLSLGTFCGWRFTVQDSLF